MNYLNETRDERYFINWFNQMKEGAGITGIMYVLLEDKERYLKTLAISRKYKAVESVAEAKLLFKHAWHRFKLKRR